MAEEVKMPKGAGKVPSKEALTKVAQSGDAQRLMELLNRDGGVQDAATAAAGGNVSQLMGMVQRLMKSPEGAELVDRISKQAKGSAGE